MAGSSPLLDLPRETRDQIYGYYLADYEPTQQEIIGLAFRPPPLYRVCGQIRDKISSIPPSKLFSRDRRVRVVKATFFSFCFDFSLTYATGAARRFDRVQTRLLLTKADTLLSPNSIKRTLRYLERLAKGFDLLSAQSTVSIVGFSPEDLVVDGADLERRLRAISHALPKPLWATIQDAIWEQADKSAPRPLQDSSRSTSDE